MIELLLGLRSPSPDDVRRALEQYAIGCVVTIEEMRRLDRATRKSMPADWRTSGAGGGLNIWARYTLAGVEPIGPLRWEGRTARRESDGSPVIGV